MQQAQIKIKWSFNALYKVVITFMLLSISILAISEIITTYEVLTINLNKTIAAILLYLITLATFIFPIWLFILRKHKVTLYDLSFIKTPLNQTIKSILKAYGLLLLTVIALSIISLIIPINEIPGFAQQENILPLFGEGKFALLISSIIIVIIAPIIEELFFRGIILKTLLSRYNTMISSGICAGLFALLHFQFNNIWQLFIISLIINHIYISNNHSIIPTITFHMLNNTIAMIVILNIDKFPQIS